MKKLLLAALLVAPAAYSQAITVRSWENPACASGPCELRSLKLHIRKTNNQNGAGNHAAIEMVTTEKSQLKKYGVVQYIKGCVFSSRVLGQNELATRNFAGQDAAPFLHRDWEIDSGDDIDPVYKSYGEPGFDRLRNYFVPRNAAWSRENPLVNERNEMWAGLERKVNSSNSIFADDFPQLAQLMDSDAGRYAGNTSLQFKVCVYEMDKIPTVVRNPKTWIPGEMGCVEFSANYLYSWSSRRFTEQTQIHPFCTQAR